LHNIYGAYEEETQCVDDFVHSSVATFTEGTSPCVEANSKASKFIKALCDLGNLVFEILEFRSELLVDAVENLCLGSLPHNNFLGFSVRFNFIKHLNDLVQVWFDVCTHDFLDDFREFRKLLDVSLILLYEDIKTRYCCESRVVWMRLVKELDVLTDSLKVIKGLLMHRNITSVSFLQL
jgi:hypothetical protein